MASKSVNCSKGKHHSRHNSQSGILLDDHKPKIANADEGRNVSPTILMENRDPNMLMETRRQKQKKTKRVQKMHRASREAVSTSKPEEDTGIVTSPQKHVSKSRKCTVNNLDNVKCLPVQTSLAEPSECIRKKRVVGTAIPAKPNHYASESKKETMKRSAKGRKGESNSGCLFQSENSHFSTAKRLADEGRLKRTELHSSVCNHSGTSELDRERSLLIEDYPALLNCADTCEVAIISELKDHEGTTTVQLRANAIQNSKEGALTKSPDLEHLHAAAEKPKLIVEEEFLVQLSETSAKENGIQDNKLCTLTEQTAAIMECTNSGCNIVHRDVLKQSSMDVLLKAEESRSLDQPSVIAANSVLFPSIGNTHILSPERNDATVTGKVGTKLNPLLEAFENLSPSQEGRVKILVRAFESLICCNRSDKQQPKSHTWSYLKVQSPSSKEGLYHKTDDVKEDEKDTIEREQNCHNSECNCIKCKCVYTVDRKDENFKPNGSCHLTQHKSEGFGPTVPGANEYYEENQTGSEDQTDFECNRVKRKYSGEMYEVYKEDFLTNWRSNFNNDTGDVRWNLLGEDAETASLEGQRKKLKGNILKPQPFKLLTEERGLMKEQRFTKKLEKLYAEEERLRVPVAHGLPWTTYEPEFVPKPPVKEQTKPMDIHLFTEGRAVERAHFDHFVEENFFYLEQQRLEEERLRQIVEEEGIKRMRKEMIPRAQLMPYFDNPFRPRRSSKPPTMPKEPAFHYQEKKRGNC